MRHSADMAVADPDIDLARTPIIHDGCRPLPDNLRGSVLLLGNFDGLHLGHRSLIAEARRWATATRRPMAILQFDPHPRHHFRGEQEFLISGTSVQRRLLAEAGIELIYAPRFNAAFAAQSAEVFVVEHLVARLGISAVVTGTDFRFGNRRSGDVPLLQAMGRALGFSTLVVGECQDLQGSGVRISSSQVRLLIRSGRLDEAQRLLARPFETAVEAGSGGWQFDPMQILPLDGIFMVEARGAAAQSLGRRALVLREGRPEARLPAGTSTLLWHARASAANLGGSLERMESGLRQS